ncbi:NAD(P)-dependent oxidoreductase [Novosphingobium sp. NBM11]|uniref:NAD-dependent epimerase/dehydratase family protein n=1 Tax=Novosphingobium sp. NBM11 TaxID=2596914 RepID=UPI0018926ABC|nr:NAD(P)-dependent oxidoreductase [Novosphingobium sp. NBM11]
MASKPGLLVTGASGFVGRHVIAQGRTRFSVVATGRGGRPDWLPSEVDWCSADLLDRASVARLPGDLPYVLHLASETVPSQFSSYAPLLDSVEMTLNLCRHLRSGRILFASSCLVYAASREPMTEFSPVDPRGGYGMAKALCEEIVVRSARSHGRGGAVETLIARPFNHIGAGMRPDLVIPAIVRRVREAPRGGTIAMAGLDSVRDFLDVEDIVEAYFSLLGLPAPAERTFNVASGRATSIGDVVRAVARVLDKPIGGVSFAASTNSADDTIAVVGNADRLRKLTGWAPLSSLDDSLRKVVAAMAES